MKDEAEVYAATVQEIIKQDKQLIDPPVSIDFRDIARCGGTAIAVGRRGVIRVSTDNGDAWQDSDSKTPSTLNAIAFSGNCETAVAVGRQGIVRVSTDRGRTWDAPETYTQNDFNDIALSDDGKTAVAVGDTGTIRFSVDRGKSWPKGASIAKGDLNGVALSRDGTRTIAVGENNIYRNFIVQDGKWERREEKEKGITTAWNNGGGDDRDDFEAIALFGSHDKSVVVVGDDGAILFSADLTVGNWSRKTTSEDRSDFKAVAFGGEGETPTVIAVGRRGVIWGSTNGGRRGGIRTNKGGNSLEAVALGGDGKRAVAVGRDGTVLVSWDNGEKWSFHNSRASSTLRAVAFDTKGETAIIVGDNSVILMVEFSSDEVADVSILQKRILEAKDMEKQPATSPIDSLSEASDIRRADLMLILILAYLTRAGIVLVFLFLAQHLFGLFRYQLRLAAYYRARRDAFQLIPENEFPWPRSIKKFDQLTQTLSPDDLEIGRPSKTIMDRMIKMIKVR